MISQRALNYAKVLYSLELKEETIQSAKELLLNNSDLMDSLENPLVNKQEKSSVIDKLFDKEISSFLKTLCENKSIGLFSEIINAYEDMVLEHKNVLRAKLAYVKKPGEAEIDQIKNMLCEKYKKTGVFLELEEDASLIGGFVLYVGNTEYDKSIKGTLSEMQKTLIRR